VVLRRPPEDRGDRDKAAWPIWTAANQNWNHWSPVSANSPVSLVCRSDRLRAWPGL